MLRLQTYNSANCTTQSCHCSAWSNLRRIVFITVILCLFYSLLMVEEWTKKVLLWYKFLKLTNFYIFRLNHSLEGLMPGEAYMADDDDEDDIDTFASNGGSIDFAASIEKVKNVRHISRSCSFPQSWKLFFWKTCICRILLSQISFRLDFVQLVLNAKRI